MENRKNADCWLYAIGMMLLAELFSLFQPIYTNIDNYCTSMMINQVYAEDGYNMFLNPVVCFDIFRATVSRCRWIFDVDKSGFASRNWNCQLFYSITF